MTKINNHGNFRIIVCKMKTKIEIKILKLNKLYFRLHQNPELLENPFDNNC